MGVIVENPGPDFTAAAVTMYNGIRSAELPDPAGTFGLDDATWRALLKIMNAHCKFGKCTNETSLRGFCIWGSVVAKKFLVLKKGFLHSNVVRVRGDYTSNSDHYFAIAKHGSDEFICDITCNQFKGAPNYFIGRLKDIKSSAKGVRAFDVKLDEVYSVGIAANEFVA